MVRRRFRRLCGWRRDQSGSVALTFLLISSLMIGSSLFAIDMARFVSARSNLQNALDAAVLSAARGLESRALRDGDSGAESAWRENAEQLFYRNLASGLKGGQIESVSLEQDANDSGRVRMHAEGRLPLLSAGYFNFAALRLQASNEAIREVRSDVELVLALDNSRSMQEWFGGRLNRLQETANSLIDTVLNAAERARRERQDLGGIYTANIGLVPFSDVVRVDPDQVPARSWLYANRSPENAFRRNYIDHLWTGCIVEPAGDWRQGNPMPARPLTPTAGFQPMHLTRSDWIPRDWPWGTRRAPLADDGRGDFVNGMFLRAVPGREDQDRRLWADWSVGQLTNIEYWGYVNLAINPVNCARDQIVPMRFLTDNRSALKNTVGRLGTTQWWGDPLTERNSGSLLGAGLLWSWRMLDPAWRGLQGWGSTQLPRDPVRTTRKAIVLISDGGSLLWPDTDLIATVRADGPQRSSYRLEYAHTGEGDTGMHREQRDRQNQLTTLGEFLQCPANALRIRDPKKVTPLDLGCDGVSIGYEQGWGLSGTSLNNFQQAVCDNIKAAGIELYVVYVRHDPGWQWLTNPFDVIQPRMRQCATNADGHFFATASPDQLSASFDTIASALTEIRLVK